jgi:C4-dicarboxylate-specific signal transduction histidine kinase
MKIAKHTISLFFLLSLISINAFTQTDVNDLDSLLKNLQTQKEDTSKVNTLIELAKNFRRSRDYANSEKTAKDALKLSEELHFKKGSGLAYYNLARCLSEQNKYDQALQYFLMAINKLEDTKDKLNTALAYHLMALTYFEQGDYAQALHRLYAAVKLYEESGSKKDLANAFQAISGVYFYQGNNSDALENNFAALKLFESLHDTAGMAQSHRNTADIYLKMELLAEALTNFSTALKMYDQLGNTFSVAYASASIGKVYEKQGEAALKAGDLLLFKDKLTEALKNYKGFMQLLQQHRNPAFLVSVYADIGRVNIKLKNLSEARKYVNKSYEIATQLKSKSAYKESYDVMSQLEFANQNFEQAYKNYKMYILYRDSLVNQETTKKIFETKMQFDFDKRQAIARLEKEKQDAEVRLTTNLQYGAIGAFLLLAVFLFLNNRNKQKAKLKIERAYDKLKSTQSQLIQSEKMASLGELTAGIAHEIQNPINFVNNFSDVNGELLEELKNELHSDNKQEALLLADDIKENEQKINHHGKRADAIVKGMLQHSRTNTGKKEPTDINALADEYLRLSYHGLRAKDKSFNSDYKTHFDESIGKVNVVPQDIGRVLLNLYNNAFYSVNEKKKAATLNAEKYEPIVEVSTKRVGDKIQIRVRDNGTGIPQKILDKVYQPFFTTKPTGQGTGLGLSLSYDIIKAHGGELKVDTKEGEGAEFIVVLNPH